jgi:hypothetical protein
VSRPTNQAPDLKAAAKAVTEIGLDPVAILLGAQFAEFLWKSLPQKVPGLDNGVRRLAYALNMNPFEYPMDPLDAPSARKILWKLRLQLAFKGGVSQDLKAIANALCLKRRGNQTPMVKEIDDRSDLAIYRGMLGQLRFAAKIVPMKLEGVTEIRSVLDSRWKEVPQLPFDNSVDDLARHLAGSRKWGDTLPDQAALWLLERRRRQGGRAAPTEVDLDEACRVRDRLLRAEVRARKRNGPGR